jgi:Enoyl-CoA hydratase/carnithine racemase
LLVAYFSVKEALRDHFSPLKDVLFFGYLHIFNDIDEMLKIIIAPVNCLAVSIGASLAMAYDLRIMTKSSYILSLFSNIVLVPDSGLNWLLT